MILASISDSTSGYLQFLTVLIIFVFVLLITLFTTRWIANYQKGKSVSSNIEVIETYRISNNRFIQVIRVGEKYLAIGVGKDEITMLAELEGEGLNLLVNETKEFADFSTILEKVKKLKDKEK